MALPVSLQFLLLQRGEVYRIISRSCSAAAVRKSTGAFELDNVLRHPSLSTGASLQDLKAANSALTVKMNLPAGEDEVGGRYGESEWFPLTRIASGQNFFLDPTQWQDNMQDTNSPLLPVTSCRRPPSLAMSLNKRPKLACENLRVADGHMGYWRALILSPDLPLSEVVGALDHLVQRGSRFDTSLFYRLLKRCTAEKDLFSGRRVHALAVECGFESNAFLANHIIGMYASHGQLDAAAQAFAKVAVPNAFMWASIILAHARTGQPKEAMDLYRNMRKTTVTPDNHVYVAALKACTAALDLAAGKQVHADILGSAVEPDLFVSNCLVDMYAKCGSLADARKLFDSLSTRDAVTWTAMIAGYVQHGLGQDAVNLFFSMLYDGITQLDSALFVCLLQACASSGDLHHGKELHKQIQQRGLEADLTVGNGLVNMYAKCGSLEDARTVFDRLPKSSVATWNAIIAGYVHHGLGQDALALFESMQRNGISADHVTFVCLLQSCSSSGALQQGRELHERIKQSELELDVVIGSCLVDMYSKCGALDDARVVFDTMPTKNLVTWTAMIAGYAQHGFGQKALTLYSNMQNESKNSADNVLFANLLQTCATDRALDQGKKLHAQIKERGLEADAVIGSCLVDMYSKCGSLDDARRVFDTLSTKTVATWTAMIGGYVKHGISQQALVLSASMQKEGITSPDKVMFGCLLQACANVGALNQGKQLHAQILEKGMERELLVGNCLVDMYAKLGRLEDAWRVLNRLVTRDVTTWTALLNGYAREGHGHRAIWCFKEMQRQGVQPDDSTFICLLVACSHEGMISEGQQYFKLMLDRGIVPTAYHYTCMVDILGRSGCLDEAEDMLHKMRSDAAVVGWTSLLFACKSHGDVERGRRCFDRLVEIEPSNASAYVLLSNIYANANMWADVQRIESLRKAAGAKKKPAMACIELQDRVHEFVVGEEMTDMSSKLRSVNARLKDEGGHVPRTELVLRAVPERDKEDALCGHAEKLALAYGLLNTPRGTTLFVTKNLRMCNDCHSGTKIMSRLERREIVVRDAHRLHRFVDGSCSCRDRH